MLDDLTKAAERKLRILIYLTIILLLRLEDDYDK